MKDMTELRSFLGVEVDRNDAGLFLSQRKDVLDLLEEDKLKDCKPLKLPMDSNVKKISDAETSLRKRQKYQRFAGKDNCPVFEKLDS